MSKTINGLEAAFLNHNCITSRKFSEEYWVESSSSTIISPEMRKLS
jgi:hypothetical protein